jgi:hypothetical protein
MNKELPINAAVAAQRLIDAAMLISCGRVDGHPTLDSFLGDAAVIAVFLRADDIHESLCEDPCFYCGSTDQPRTVARITPSEGFASKFNVVAACVPCAEKNDPWFRE